MHPLAIIWMSMVRTCYLMDFTIMVLSSPLGSGWRPGLVSQKLLRVFTITGDIYYMAMRLPNKFH